jgi:hypothetical protein
VIHNCKQYSINAVYGIVLVDIYIYTYCKGKEEEKKKRRKANRDDLK